MIKKSVILILLMAAVALGSVSAQSSDSANLTISGTVGTVTRLTLSNTGNATGIALTDPTTAPITIADVTEIANTSYNVSISTTNGFEFQSPTAASGAVPYTITYAGQTINTTTQVKTGAARGTVTESVLLEHVGAGSEDDPATDYADTVTFTITAN